MMHQEASDMMAVARFKCTTWWSTHPSLNAEGNNTSEENSLFISLNYCILPPAASPLQYSLHTTVNIARHHSCERLGYLTHKMWSALSWRPREIPVQIRPSGIWIESFHRHNSPLLYHRYHYTSTLTWKLYVIPETLIFHWKCSSWGIKRRMLNKHLQF